MSASTTVRSSAAPIGGPRRAWSIAWPWLFWALWGASLAAWDQRSDDTGITAGFLLAGCAVLGFARPRHAWGWALALAAWIPGEILIAALRHVPLTYPANPGMLIALVPALLGAALGRALASLRTPAGDPPSRA